MVIYLLAFNITILTLLKLLCQSIYITVYFTISCSVFNSGSALQYHDNIYRLKTSKTTPYNTEDVSMKHMCGVRL